VEQSLAEVLGESEDEEFDINADDVFTQIKALSQVDLRKEVLSNPNSVIENEILRREEEEKFNREKIEVPVENIEEKPKSIKKDHLGSGLNKDKYQKEIIELRKKTS
jgi:hypothetical protein